MPEPVWMGMENTSSLSPTRVQSLDHQPVASRYTDYIILTPKDLTGEKEVNDSILHNKKL